ncbi:uncharacterized protein ColSpa_07169 [Colletotrichum spaethianum]|uniref:Uncharacterized protein n=1 Tax=Colletotrichum spaethianum TaxID=700344 RepID=A0AA37P2S3_9PEZI|nr:uncharacterized protein ColSpa_07169 [Colletotrichum spaethianum]GKT46988.1 hypothetical protein ColSpa_07169 [Colletotrichum spaethianum]
MSALPQGTGNFNREGNALSKQASLDGEAPSGGAQDQLSVSPCFALGVPWGSFACQFFGWPEARGSPDCHPRGGAAGAQSK